MRLLLVRHGRTAHNVDRLLDTAYPGAPLDETGHEQARAVAERLAEHPIDAIYVSDLIRTQQTAAPLAALRGLTPRIRAGLREIQAGDYELSPDWSGYVATIFGWTQDPQLRMPGGETLVEVLARFDEVVAEAHGEGHDTVAMVSHGAMLRSWTITRARNLTPEFVRSAPIDNTVVIDLEGDPRQGWHVHRWGDRTP